MNRREALSSAAVAIAASGLLPGNAGSSVTAAIAGRRREQEHGRKPYIETDDGTMLFYQDWGYRQMHSFHPQHLPEFSNMAIQHGSFISARLSVHRI